MSPFVIRYLAAISENDQRTVLGRNLEYARMMTKEEIPSRSGIFKCLLYSPVPEEEKWREGIGKDLLQIREGDAHLEGFTPEQIDLMLTSICIS